MKKQYLFSALAFSAFLASCNNEIETVAESVKPEAEMEEVVGATLVSKGMSIDVNGPESRRTKEGWEETDLLGMGWYNVGGKISDEQTIAGWEATMANSSYAEHRIFANHKFINFATESNVYQGAHFVYFPYKRETMIQQKVVEANALDYTVSAAESMTDAEYDMYNRAFQLSAQDFVSGQDVDDNGELKKQFRLSPMVNGMTVNAIPTLEETATAIKGLKITSVEILSQQSEAFAEKFAIKPNLIPAVERTEEGEIDGTATDAALDAYIKGAEKAYVNKIARNVAAEANYDLSVQRDINVYTFPTKVGYDKTAVSKPIIYVNVVSPNGLVGQFAAAQYAIHTAKNKETVQKLHEFLGNSTATLQNVLRLDGVWTTLSLPTELDESNLVMTYNINNKAQWDDAVALAKEIGNDATFTLTDEVEFTESINLPEGIKLTVVGNGSMVIDGDIEWPNTDDLDVTAANIVVEEGVTLSINGEEGDRNALVGKLVNKGTIALNEYGTVGGKNSQIKNTYTDGTVQKNGRVEVKYGSYVYADGGIVAFEVLTDTPAYQINNLITDDETDADDGQALVNTLVVNEGNELNLNAENPQESTYDPYAGTNVTVPAAQLTDLSKIDIEMNGGKIYGKLGDVEEVNNVKVLSGTANSIVDVTIKGDLIVENDAKATVDATPNIYGKKYTAYVEGDIINGGTINADVDIITTDVINDQQGKSKLYVSAEKTVWYTETYKQGGLAEGNVLKKSLAPSIQGTDVTVVYNLEMLNAALNQNKNNIAFGANIEGDFTLTQKTGNNIVIDGNGFMYTGKILINGDRRNEGTETLTIQNVNFNVTYDNDNPNNGYYFITASKTYAHNVTVKTCTFTASGTGSVVGMLYNQAYHMNVEDCEGTGLHSLMQASSIDNDITVKRVTLMACKEGGVAFGNTKNAVIEDSKIFVVGNYGYGVRSDADRNDSYLTVKNCTMEADAPILVRYAKEKYKLALEGENDLSATDGYQIIVTAAKYTDGAALTAPTGNVTITGAEGMSIFK